jgi:methyl-accepting chemotaxis protein
VRWKLSLGKKLGLAFAAVLVLMMVSSLTSYLRVDSVNRLQSEFTQNSVPTLDCLRQLQRDLYRSSSKSRQAILSGPQANKRDDALKKWDVIWNDIGRDAGALAALAPKWSQEENRERLARIEERLPQVRTMQRQVIDVAGRSGRRGVVRAGNLYGDKVTPFNDATVKDLGDFAEAQEKLIVDSARAIAAANAALRWTLALSALAALATGIFLAIFLGRRITRAAVSLLAQAEAIAAGDLTRSELAISSHDELGDLTVAVNKMSASLKRTVLAMVENSTCVASASEELTASAQLQAQGADAQKDQTTQVAAAMHEMAATVHDVSENSRKAADASQGAAQAARQGGEVVQETLATMRGIADSTKAVAGRISELGKSSQQIGKIISVIDDIADQTNLLALNAAIEAARAGEQGRGFAVVADEVRKLAERTTKATKEIADMIESIQVETKHAVRAMEAGNVEVEKGVQKTAASGAALADIIKMSETVGDMISQIATAATEQSATTEEINRSVTRISTTAQESSAGAGETAKACGELSARALELQNIVKQFRVTGDEGKKIRKSGSAMPERAVVGAQKPLRKFAGAGR